MRPRRVSAVDQRHQEGVAEQAGQEAETDDGRFEKEILARILPFRSAIKDLEL